MLNGNQNVGFLDRLVRGLLAIDLLAACFIAFVDGPVILLFWLLAGYLILTGLTGVCPLYAALRHHTRQRTEP